jgi:hypothetical protein
VKIKEGHTAKTEHEEENVDPEDSKDEKLGD